MEGTIGEIRMFAGNFAPKNWAFCAAQIIQISSNTALFSILGTTYGGNGTTTFALPDLQGRFPVGTGGSVALGQKGGTETTTLTEANLAPHSHTGGIKVQPNNGSTNTFAGNFPASLAARVNAPGYSIQVNAFGPPSGGNMAASMVTLYPSGNNVPVATINPYLGMNYVICQYGVFPQRS